jgi:signal transduction histidine kinase
MAGAHSKQGRVQSAIEALYSRWGSRVLLIAFGICFVTGLPAALLIAEFEARFLGWSASQMFALLELWVPTLFALGVAFLFIWAEPWRTILRWRGARSRAPEETWEAIMAIRRAATRVMVPIFLGMAGAVVYEVHHFHERWYALGVQTGVDYVCMIAWTLLALSIIELMLRPMLEDVAARLPAEFHGEHRAMSLRAKVLLPLPAVTMFAGLLVGAYANVHWNGSARFALTAGLAFATAAVASAIQLVINRSLLSPVDDLLAATRRVRAGDLMQPVPVISTDELGLLAHSFNEMQEGLRQRETLRAELEASRTRIVAAADAERRRMERDLHDGAQQHLVLLHLKLGRLARTIEDDPRTAATQVEELRDEVRRAQSELRDLAHGIYPQALERDGLRAALRQVVEHGPLAASLECDGIGRYSAQVEAAVYFCCREALQNATKHAGASATVEVRVAQHDGALRFEVVDDGVGFDPQEAGVSAGMLNMTDRVGALGGTLEVRSTPGAGTTVAGTVPV